MKNRSKSLPSPLVQEYVDKRNPLNNATYVYAPTGWSETFTVLADQLNGDFSSFYAHAFRKNTINEYVGFTLTDESSYSLRQTGMVGGFSHFADAEPDSWDYLHNQCLADMLEKLRSGEVGSGLDLSVSILEGRQVAKMVGGLTPLLSYVRSVRPRTLYGWWLEWKYRDRLKNDWKYLRDNHLTRDSVGKKWLAWQYGWRPLAQDVYNTADAIMNRRLNQYARITGKARDHSMGSKTFTGTLFTGSKETVDRSSQRRMMMRCEFSMDNTTKQQLAGYTSLNPASILWELTPYSFVVDWAINIGGYLRSMETALLYKQAFVRGFSVQGFRDLQSGFVTGFYQSGSSIRTGSASASIRQSYKRRSPIGVMPLPVLPSFKANLGWQRFASAASLMQVHLGKR